MHQYLIMIRIHPQRLSYGTVATHSRTLSSSTPSNANAIANSLSSKTLPMPHLPNRRILLQPSPPSMLSAISKKPFNLSRSLHKLIRSVFKTSNKSSSISSNSSSRSIVFEAAQKSKDRYYVVYYKLGPVLSTIPEVSEFEIVTVSPGINSLVRRSASESFMSLRMGISYVRHS